MPGVVESSFGLNVARMARIPEEVLQSAARASQQVQQSIAARSSSTPAEDAALQCLRRLREARADTVCDVLADVRRLCHE